MYIPEPFREDSLPVLHDALRAIVLGTLITRDAGGDFDVAHVPTFLDATQGPYGTLYGHLAKANPQSFHMHGQQALAIFLGPHAYISPTWYPSKATAGKVVPTWNYQAIHVHGTVECFDDPDALRNHLTQMTQVHEATQSVPWTPEDAPADYLVALMQNIVGFRLMISKLEGKYKMSQNRPAQDRQGVHDALRGQDGGLPIADLMESCEARRS